ncbi:hypothetical protein BGZ60DRAFT_404364 [Tricladium varicosporioides]|nr:hypothetical protein BGZ60DRAFT_404364 [Hymenoscyphus varicosporioides]
MFSTLSLFSFITLSSFTSGVPSIKAFNFASRSASALICPSFSSSPAAFPLASAAPSSASLSFAACQPATFSRSSLRALISLLAPTPPLAFLRAEER